MMRERGGFCPFHHWEEVVMRVITLVFAAILCVLLGSIILAASKPKMAIANADGPPNRYTGAPGDLGTCGSCHTGASGTGALVLNLQAFNGGYTPGVIDTFYVFIADPAPTQMRWGFQVTALKNSDNTAAGTLTPLATQGVWTGSSSAGGRTYIATRSNGSTTPMDSDDGTYWGFTGAVAWGVQWQAPTAGAGPVTFYVSAISANADELASGADNTYTNTLVVPESGTSPVTSTTWGKIKKKYP